VVAVFGEGLALAVDGGPLPGTPSTVVDATGPWRVLRAGELSLETITAAAG
jgi:tRNA A37 threonylcarbamoyladenosine synthetase subunit TsaC/SUA5/YrdC